jgi:hypothetical protein
VAEAMNPTTEEEKIGGNTTKSSPS